MMGAFAVAPPAALSRILSGFDRPTLAGFIEVAISLLDIADGDPDFEETGSEDSFQDHRYGDPGCPVSDPGGPSWLERLNQTRPPMINGTAHFQSHEDAEEDDGDGECTDDVPGFDRRARRIANCSGSGPGCSISDPDRDEGE